MIQIMVTNNRFSKQFASILGSILIGVTMAQKEISETLTKFAIETQSSLDGSRAAITLSYIQYPIVVPYLIEIVDRGFLGKRALSRAAGIAGAIPSQPAVARMSVKGGLLVVRSAETLAMDVSRPVLPIWPITRLL